MATVKAKGRSLGGAITVVALIMITLISLGTLGGWGPGLRTLVQVILDTIAMQYNAALCFLVLGVSGCVVVMQGRRRLLSAAGATFVALMGAGVILEYTAGMSPGVGPASLQPWEQTPSAHPGRMALTSAISFLLSGGGLAILAIFPRAITPFAILNTIPIGLGLTSAVGHLHEITYTLHFRAGSQMAIYTSLAFIVYGSAMLLYAWRQSPRGREGLPAWAPALALIILPVFLVGFATPGDTTSVRLVQVFLSVATVGLLGLAIKKLSEFKIAYKGLVLISIPLAFVLGFVALVREVQRGTEQSQRWSRHSQEVIKQSEGFIRSLIDAQSAVRGYVITGNPVFVEPYHDSRQQITRIIRTLEELVQDNPEQLERLNQVSTLALKRLEMLERLERLVASGERDRASEDVAGGSGKHLMDEFRGRMADFLQEEERIGVERQRAVERSWERFNWLLTAGASANILLMIALALLFSRGISSRLQALAENARALSEGKQLSSRMSGADEIAKLDHVFHDMAAALEKAARKERSLVENALDVICSMDAKGRFVNVSPASFKTWGYRPEELIGRRYIEFVVPEDAAKTEQVAAKIMAGNAVSDFENCYRHKNGSQVYMMWSALWSEGDQLVFCVGRDNTERKKAQEALQRYASEVSDLYNHAPCGYHSLDAEGTFVQINDTELAWLGYSRDEVIGKLRFPDLLTPESLQVFSESFPKFKERGWSGDLEFQIVRRNGEAMTVLLNATAIKDASGNYVSSRSTLFDITERKRAEEEIKELNKALEARASEVEASNKELEAFSYSVSHDLRAPLRAIDGFSRMLLEDYQDRLDGNGQRLLDVIRGNTQRMGALIDDLLAFSRLGRRPMAISSIDMTLMAKDAFEELMSTSRGREVDFRIDSLPPAPGDPAMIRQVFVNLLSNAIKYTTNRETSLIEVDGWVEDGHNVYTVKDNGVGFDMQYANKLFGVFQRLHSAEEFEGTGVGLALVQRIVNRHGGSVWAEAKVNEGATFYFSLPRGGE